MSGKVFRITRNVIELDQKNQEKAKPNLTSYNRVLSYKCMLTLESRCIPVVVVINPHLYYISATYFISLKVIKRSWSLVNSSSTRVGVTDNLDKKGDLMIPNRVIMM